MIDCNENRQLLREMSQEYGIAVSEEQASQLLRHLDLVVEENKKLNLTRITEPYDAMVRHTLDSLLFMPAIDSSGFGAAGRYLDIGTGGGFPGIPIGNMSDMNGLLIDSVGKKVNAVREMLSVLGLAGRVDAQSQRAEVLALEQPHAFDLVTARAVAELKVLVEYASPLLKMHGNLVVSKARIQEIELGEGDKTADIVGLKRVSRETYELPDDMGHREIIVYERVAKSKVKLPREVGLAKHKPLVR